MNKRIKKLWIEALRSGKYQQTDNALRRGSGAKATFCCLGVLCDLHRIETGGSWKGGDYLDELAVLPPAVVEWGEMLDDNPEIPEVDLDTNKPLSLAELNDNKRDFNYIADRIEKYL